MSTTVTGTATFSLPANQTAAQIVATVVADPTALAALKSALAPVVQQPPTPPPPPPPTAGTVYSNGVFHWGGDFDYGGAVANYQAKNPVDGSSCLQITSTPTNSTPPTMGAGGGWLPWYKAGVGFDLTPYKFVNVSLMATRVGQVWTAVQPYGLNDSQFPGSTSVDISGTPNVWVTKKIPLGAGGYNLPAGAQIAKLGFQDQMPWGPHPENAPNNVYYINNVYFSAT